MRTLTPNKSLKLQKMIRRHHHIPVEILIEIIKRINDLKSLIRLRLVSKAWKSLIDSKDFIAAHTAFLVSQPETQHHRLLIRYEDLDKSGYKFVSFVDDDSYRHGQKVTLFAPHSVAFFDYGYVSTRLVGSSHGLLCFYDTLTTKKAVIWNPSIRKSVAVTFPNVLNDNPYQTLVGFGVCHHTLDPKLVKINSFTYGIDLEYRNSVIPHHVEVFTLSSGSWRGPLSSNLPDKSINFGHSEAVIGGFIYWNAFVKTTLDGKSKYCNLVISFDLTSEEFRKVYLPDILPHNPKVELKVSKLRDSLAVIELSPYPDVYFYCAVWMMTGHGYSKCFKMVKLFNYGSPDTLVFTALGFTKSGAPIIEIIVDMDQYISKLYVYEPCSQQNHDIGIYGISEGCSFFLNSYIETLLLLDQ